MFFADRFGDEMRDRWSREVWELHRRAHLEARRLDHGFVGTGHLLLAILSDPAWGDRVVRILLVEPERLRTEIRRLMPRDRVSVRPGMRSWTPTKTSITA